MRGQRLTIFILAGMVLGVAVGAICHEIIPDPARAKAVAADFSVVTDIFLRLIKMIIAPLVFTTLVAGVARMGDAATIGRVGLKTMGWFVSASLVSLLLGLVMVNLLRPGENIGLPLPQAGAATDVKAATLTVKDFIAHLVPRSIAEAMAQNEILQIVVFSIFFGIAAASLGERAGPVVAVVESAAEIILKVTGYVMGFAPFAVFAALAATVTTMGLGVLANYARFVISFYASLALLWALLVVAAFVVLRGRAFSLVAAVRAPFLIAFSTASSEAAYPRTLEALERFGASPRIASFVLPLGYSFNLDGSMAYATFGTIFIAQAYGIAVPLGTQLSMLLLLMLTSKGIAGVPRASLVVIAATLTTFNLPEGGLLLLLGVDQILDMGRSATNVLGNSIASAVVAKWEGELAPARALETV